MELLEEHINTRYGRFVQWFDKHGVNNFTYEDHDGIPTLWDEIESPYGTPVATPDTLEIARYIIEQAGHTIS